MSMLSEDLLTEFDAKLKQLVYDLGEKIDPELVSIVAEIAELKNRVDSLERKNVRFNALVAIYAAELGITPEELIVQAVNYFVKKFGERKSDMKNVNDGD